MRSQRKKVVHLHIAEVQYKSDFRYYLRYLHGHHFQLGIFAIRYWRKKFEKPHYHIREGQNRNKSQNIDIHY